VRVAVDIAIAECCQNVGFAEHSMRKARATAVAIS
jgi:hypothetical protein